MTISTMVADISEGRQYSEIEIPVVKDAEVNEPLLSGLGQWRETSDNHENQC